MSREQLTLFAEDSPARTSAPQESGRDSPAIGRGFGGSLLEWWTKHSRGGWSLKTCRVYSLPQADEILPPSFDGWQTAGMAWGGECLTLRVSDLPSDGNACSLSEVLEPETDARYFLTAKACAGILTRADRRGKIIPEPLRTLLQQLQHDDQTGG